MNCRLCQSPVTEFAASRGKRYQQCSHCQSVLMHAADLPDPDTEKALYLTHNNDIHDPRYQAFVSPVTSAVLCDFAPGSIGLDFGAGPGPVVQYMLRQQGYSIKLYDPFFYPDPAPLERQYDFIVCSEVMEHFHQPAASFLQLRKLLKPAGKLYCMTSLFEPEMDFANWHYKNDPTHVFFYHRKALDWIVAQLGFADVDVDGRLICFRG